MSIKKSLYTAVVLALLVLVKPANGNELAPGTTRYFPETQHNVSGRLLEYWIANGGVAQQGYPLTEEFQEVNKLDGKIYTVQYFERAIFEKHPENQPPYDVLLSQLGSFELTSRYPNSSNAAAAPAQPIVGPLAAGSGLMGQTVAFPGASGVGLLEGRITAVRETQTLQASAGATTLTADGKFVLIFMTVCNIGNSSAEPGDVSFRLKDIEAGAFNMADFEQQLAAQQQHGRKGVNTTIPPGLSAEMVFVFDVDPAATSYSILPND